MIKKHDDARWGNSWCFCFEFEIECCVIDNPYFSKETWIAQGEAVYDRWSGEMYVWSMTRMPGFEEALHLKFEDDVAWCRFEGPHSGAFELFHDQCHERMEGLTKADSGETTPTTVGTATTTMYPLPQPIAMRGVKFTDIASTFQRNPAKLLPVGTRVTVKKRDGTCFQDGLVIEHARDGGVRDGGEVRGGSMKVWYDQGNRLKWVAPSSTSDTLIPKPAEECPPLRPWGAFGTLRVLKGSEVDLPFRWDEAKAATAYVEVHGGYLQWWNNIDSGRKGKPSDGNAELSRTIICWWSDRNVFIVADPCLAAKHSMMFIIPCCDATKRPSEGLNCLWKTALKAQDPRRYTEKLSRLPVEVIGAMFL